MGRRKQTRYVYTTVTLSLGEQPDFMWAYPEEMPPSVARQDLLNQTLGWLIENGKLSATFTARPDPGPIEPIVRRLVDAELRLSAGLGRLDENEAASSPEGKRAVFAHYWTSGDSAVWGCPLCGSVCGHGIEWCEGDMLDDEDGGDTRHARVMRPDGVLARVERLRTMTGEGSK